MKKNTVKVLVLILSVCLFLCASGCDVFNVFVRAHNLKLVRNAGAYTVREAINSRAKEFTIPYAHDDGLIINAMGENAFMYCEELEKVDYLGTLDQWVSISFAGNSANPAFMAGSLYLNGTKLENAKITTATTIKKFSLANCDSITSIEISSTVETIGEGAFSRCDGFTEIFIPNTVQSIGLSALSYCELLSSVTFEQGSQIINLEVGMFYGCSGLTNVQLPSTIEKIGESCFYYCTSLESITLPSSLTEIGNMAFKYCSLLSSIKYEGTVEEWGLVVKGTDWINGTNITQIECSNGIVNI